MKRGRKPHPPHPFFERMSEADTITMSRQEWCALYSPERLLSNREIHTLINNLNKAPNRPCRVSVQVIDSPKKNAHKLLVFKKL